MNPCALSIAQEERNCQMDLQEKYDELDTIVRKLNYLIDEISDKNYKEQLELIKYEAQSELDEIEPRLLEQQRQEEKWQELEYERSVL